MIDHEKLGGSDQEPGAKGDDIRVHRRLFRRRNFTHALLRLFMFPSYYNPLCPFRTFTWDTLGYTGISRPPAAFVTLPILITHDARCDLTREVTQDRHSLFSYTVFRRFYVRFEKCLHQRLTCARQRCGICGVRLYEQDQFLFGIHPGTKVVITRFSGDSTGHGQEQLDAVIQNSGITTSRYHCSDTWRRVKCCEDARPSSELELDGKQKNLSQFSNDRSLQNVQRCRAGIANWGCCL